MGGYGGTLGKEERRKKEKKKVLIICLSVMV
jgi:hypothetical protein